MSVIIAVSDCIWDTEKPIKAYLYVDRRDEDRTRSVSEAKARRRKSKKRARDFEMVRNQSAAWFLSRNPPCLSSTSSRTFRAGNNFGRNERSCGIYDSRSGVGKASRTSWRRGRRFDAEERGGGWPRIGGSHSGKESAEEAIPQAVPSTPTAHPGQPSDSSPMQS